MKSNPSNHKVNTFQRQQLNVILKQLHWDKQYRQLSEHQTFEQLQACLSHNQVMLQSKRTWQTIKDVKLKMNQHRWFIFSYGCFTSNQTNVIAKLLSLQYTIVQSHFIIEQLEGKQTQLIKVLDDLAVRHIKKQYLKNYLCMNMKECNTKDDLQNILSIHEQLFSNGQKAVQYFSDLIAPLPYFEVDEIKYYFSQATTRQIKYVLHKLSTLMNFKLILGQAGCGKTTYLLTQMKLPAKTCYKVLTKSAMLSEQISIRYDIKAQTIDKFCQLRGQAYVMQKTSFHTICLDDASLISWKAFVHLINHAPKLRSLYLTGDTHQMSTFEDFNWFNLIMAQISKDHVIELKNNYRVQNPLLLKYYDKLYNVRTSKNIQASIDEVLQSIPVIDNLKQYFKQHQSTFIKSKIKILVQSNANVDKVHKSLFNEQTYDIFASKKYYCHHLYQCYANDYQSKTFNGMYYQLIKEYKHSLHFIKQSDQSKVIVNKEDSYRFKLGYCQTIFKSQGVEFETIILALPKSSTPIKTDSLLTALTRARAKVYLTWI